MSYLKISPVKLQIKVLTRRADINRHLDTVRREMAQEKNEQCRLMQEDYLSFVQQIGAREAVTRRFFLIFEYEPWNNTRRSEQEEEAKDEPFANIPLPNIRKSDKFIQQVMGHADFSTTMDIYTHITQESMKEKAEVIKDDLVLM